MNLIRSLSAIAVAVAFVGTHGAALADQGKTRADVRAELQAAQQAGDFYYGPSGKKANELFPDRYAPVAVKTAYTPLAAPADPGKTRAQVRAELEAAQQSGEIVVSFAARKQRDLFPGQFPAANDNGGVATTGSEGH